MRAITRRIRPAVFLGAMLACMAAARPAAALQRANPGENPDADRITPATLRSILAGRLPSGAPIDLANYGPVAARTSQFASSWITQIAMPAHTIPTFPPELGGTALVIRIHVPSTDRDELFMVYAPPTPPGISRPMLVAFHGFGVSHLDIFFNTTFLDEAAQRGWFLFAPMQISDVGDRQINFASPQSQEHVEVAMAYVTANYAVDLDRVYGVGFSMGGGNALSFAARHRDRRHGAFAAVVNHTGTVALSDVYSNSATSVQDEMHLLFGGPPTPGNFEYLQSSLIELDGSANLVPGGDHMAVNLEWAPVRTWYTPADFFAYLVTQSLRLDEYMATLPGADHQLITVADTCPQFLGHCWANLDQASACDFLEQHTLVANPPSGTVLADRDGRWVQYDVVQETSGAFSRFDYALDAPLNAVTLDASENVESIAIDPVRLGLDPAQPFEITTGGADGTGDRILVHGLASPPLAVTRNGAPAANQCPTSASSASWCYDAQTGVLEIREVGASPKTWRITP